MMMLARLQQAAFDAGDGLRRRAILVRQPAPPGVRAPPLGLLWRELGVLFGSRRGLDRVIRAERPVPVMLLPGFGAHPARMRHLAAALEQAGHRVHHWGMGFNFGPTAENFEFLVGRVGRIARIEHEPVVLVGWSLGGLFAREIAKARPEAVAKVITLGTPFSGDRRANNAWRAYQAITGHAVDQPPIHGDFAVKPPVPTVAVWSVRDGVIAPRCARGRPGERDRAVAVRCSHLEFVASPQAIEAVLRELDRAEAPCPLPSAAAGLSIVLPAS